MTAPLTPTTRADILRRFYRDGQNTFDIGVALEIDEAQAAAVLREERERRVRMDAGRSER